MAVDTATKRYSMINFSAGDSMFPVPVNGVDAADRSHLLELYSGLAAAAPSVGSGNRLMMTGMGG